MASQDGKGNGVELEPVTCWPLIYGAAGFAGAVALAVGAVWAFNALRPGPAADPGVRDKAPGFAFAPLAAPKDEAPTPQPFREERQVVKRALPPPRSPLAGWPAFRKPDGLDVAVKPSKPAKPKPPLSSLARRVGHDEKTLRDLLWKETSELALEKEEDRKARERKRVRSPVPAVKDDKEPLTAGIRALVRERADLRGLPLLAESECLSSKDAAKLLAAISRRVRPIQLGERAVPWRSSYKRGALFKDGQVVPVERTELDPFGHEAQAAIAEMTDFLRRCRRSYANEPLAVGPLLQIFGPEAEAVREELVGALASIDGKEATVALAKLAVFDLSPKVRGSATAALILSKAADARPVFLAALRHVWAPAADHAAHALVELDDREARGPLKKLLEAPPPGAPFQKGEKWHRRELVRVNHLSNCFLCHAPSDHGPKDRSRDALITPVPVPGKYLPEVYDERRSRSPQWGVRADIVYLRQDFSVMHKVENASPWPRVQRFDYLVRERELAPKEEAKLRAQARNQPGVDYPQLRAVKSAIEGLNRRERAGPKK
jgi:hypothetical protein